MPTKMPTATKPPGIDFLIKTANDELDYIARKYPSFCIGFSGGKDSRVLLDLCIKKFGSDINVTFANTNVEFKETIEYVHRVVSEMGVRFTELHPYPKGNLVHHIIQRNKLGQKHHGKNLGLWMVARYRPCCDSLKKAPLYRYMKKNNIALSIDGRRRQESRRRAKTIRQLINHFPKPHAKLLSASPLREWSDSDINDYIKEYALELNPIYAMGYRRCGCAPCPCPNKGSDYYGLLRINHPKWYNLIYRLRPPQESFYRHVWMAPLSTTKMLMEAKEP